VANTIDGFQGSGATSVATERLARESPAGATERLARESPAGATSRTPQPARDNTSTATTANPQSEGNEEVQITSTAAQLASLGQKLSSLPAIDQSRVARITQSLADGSYSISADKIASGLLQSDHALSQIGL
jgi:negative regulator of flagellin synthesis FlgM